MTQKPQIACCNIVSAKWLQTRRNLHIRNANGKKSQKAAIAKEFAWSPIFDKNFAFTGDFFLDRDYLEGLLKDVGANLREKVNTKTVYLVVGDISHLPEWAVARKLGKANELIAEGQNITKLTESEYIALIEQTRALKQKNRVWPKDWRNHRRSQGRWPVPEVVTNRSSGIK